MSLNPRLQKVLADEFIWYRIQPYHGAVDAQHVAAAVHVPGDVVAKTVVLRDGDGAFLMLVLPASCALDLAAVRQSTGRPALRLAHEAEFAPLFPDCAVGAMPPFGALYGLPLLADACLLDGQQIAFRGGTHETLVRVRSDDWVSVARPVVGAWCRRHAHAV
ncbi:MAG: YbaK/EbsC family protein [Vicinamibacteria bacterium]